MQLKGIWSDRPAYNKLIIITGIAVASFSILSLVSTILMKFIFNLDVISNPQILTDLSSPHTVEALKFLQLFNALGLFVLPPFIYAYLASNNIGKTLGVYNRPKLLQLLLAGLSMFIALPLINWLAEINSSMHLPKIFSGMEAWMKQSEESAAKITSLFLKVDSISGLIYNLLLIAFLPAFGEELLFRGTLQPLLKEQTGNKVAGIVLAAVIFSALHMQFYGFLPRMMMGVYFGFLFVWTQSLWVPVFAHLVNNGTAVIVSYLYGNTSDLETAGSTEGGLIYLVGSIIGLGAIIFWFHKNKTNIS
jgi:membrane protease YdiL (CAAX protease family)